MFEQWLDSLAAQAAMELEPEVLEQFRGAKWFGHCHQRNPQSFGTKQLARFGSGWCGNAASIWTGI